MPQAEEIPFGRPMIGEAERAAVADVLESPQLVHGPRAREFEQRFAEFLGADAHATSVSSATAGLHLIYLHLGVGPGDEVIVPAETHVATAHAVLATGATPVFVDCDASGNIDPTLVEAALTPATRAVCVVHYPGLPVDMAAIKRVTDPRNLFVVEDCALAPGASIDGVACGLLGDAGAFSFYPAKHMTTGEGGMVVSKHAEVVDSISRLKAFNYDRTAEARVVPGVYDIAGFGLNYRLSEMAAAMGLVQLSRLPSFLQARQVNADALRAGLAEIPDLRVLPEGDSHRVHANYCLTAVLTGELAGHRNDLLLRLKDQGIGTSVHYPVPLPLSRFYSSLHEVRAEDFPNASELSYSGFALPLGPHLNVGHMDRIAHAVASTLDEMRSA